MTLYLPIGPPASGKSFLFRNAVIGWVHDSAVVSTDDLRVKLTGCITDQSANAAVFSIAELMIDSRLKRGLDVWYDATNLVAAWRANAVRAAEFYSTPIVSILMTSHDELCRERNRMRGDLAVPADVMETMLAHRRAIRTADLPGKVITDTDIREHGCSIML